MCLVRLFGVQAHKECYTAKCRQQCSPGHYNSVPIERKFQVINNLLPERFPPWCFSQQTGQQMEAECFSGSCPQYVSPGHAFLVAIKRECTTTFVWKKKVNYLLRFIPLRADARGAVTLLIVGSHVHRDTKFWELSNDSCRSSTTFNREDGPFGV